MLTSSTDLSTRSNSSQIQDSFRNYTSIPSDHQQSNHQTYLGPSGTQISSLDELYELLKNDDYPEWYLPILYIKTQKGYIRQWILEFVCPDIITTSFNIDPNSGIQHKPAVHRREILINSSGRSIHEQAFLQSIQKHKVKIRKGFSTEQPIPDTPTEEFVWDEDNNGLNSILDEEEQSNILQYSDKQQFFARSSFRSKDGMSNQLLKNVQKIKHGKSKALKNVGDCRLKSKDIPIQLSCVFNKSNGTFVKICYPVIVQPKLDGIRARATLVRNGIDLISRGVIKIKHLNHIRDELSVVFKYVQEGCMIKYVQDYSRDVQDLDGDVQDYSRDIQDYSRDIQDIYDLDGELYIHEVPRQDLQSIIFTRKSEHPRNKEVKYYIFDIIAGNMGTESRVSFLMNVMLSVRYSRIMNGEAGMFNLSSIFFVLSEKVYSFDELNKYLDEMLRKKYEGIVIRHTQGILGLYKGNRNNNLLKYKLSDETDDIIVDIEAGVSSTTGRNDLGIPVIKLRSGRLVNIPMSTTEEKKIRIFHDKEFYIGKYLVYKHDGLTNDGIPNFPRGQYIRLDI